MYIYIRLCTGVLLLNLIQVSHLFNDESLGVQVDISVVALLLLQHDEVTDGAMIRLVLVTTDYGGI